MLTANRFCERNPEGWGLHFSKMFVFLQEESLGAGSQFSKNFGFLQQEPRWGEVALFMDFFLQKETLGFPVQK